MLWQGAFDAARSSPTRTTRLDALEAMSAIMLMLLHEEEQRNERAAAAFEARVTAPSETRFEVQLRAVPVTERHVWLKRQICRHLQDQHPAIIQAWAQSTRLSADAVKVAVSIFEDGELDLAAYSGMKERPVYLLEAPFQAVETEAGRSGLAPTPATLARFMVEMLDPKPGERIYDIGCGTGSLLLAAWKHIESQLDRMSAREHQRIQQGTLFGVEVNPISAFIALARLKLAGIARPHLFTNSIENRPATTTYDVVLCDPPWGMPMRRDHEGSTRPISSEHAMLEDVLQHLAPGGRAAVLLPKGFLSRGGSEGRLRRRLLSEFRLEAVMDMPKGLLNFTTIAPTLLLIRHASPRLTVAFSDASISQQFVKAPRDPGWESIQVADVRAAIAREASPDHLASHIAHVSIDEILASGSVLDPRRYRREPTPDFFTQLRDLFPKTQISRLEEVAEVFRGRSNWKKEESAIDPTSTAIIRISDVSGARLNDDGLPVVTTCRDFLDVAQERNLSPDQWLKPDDLVFTIDGTIGKIAFVGDSFKDAVAGQGIAVIRCKAGLEPSYLLAMLRTEPYLTLVQQHRAGSAIPHLRLSDLRSMPVPVLPLELQRRLSAAKEGQSAATLLALLNANDSFSFWERILLDSPNAAELGGYPTKHENASVAVAALQRLVDDDLHPHREAIRALRDSDFDAVRSFTTLAKEAESLNQILQLADSADKALVLQVWRQRQASPVATSVTSAIASRLDELHEAMMALSRHEWERLLAGTSLTIKAEPATLHPGLEQAVTLTVTNSSQFPLIGVEVKVPFQAGPLTHPFLPAGQSINTTINVTPKNAHLVDLRFPWSAKRVDMTDMQGELELPLRVDSLPTTTTPAPVSPGFRTNPYVTGMSLDEKSDWFFGREDIIDEVKSLLRPTGPSTVIILEGVRRVGKSSLLKQLLRPEMLPGWLPIYYDFQTADGTASDYGVPTADIFSCILRETLATCHRHQIEVLMPELSQGAFDLSRSDFGDLLQEVYVLHYRHSTTPFATFVSHMERVVSSLNGRRLLLMLDEFDKTQAGIENGITSPQIAENFRSLFHSHPEISAILTGSQLMKRLRAEYFHPLFGIGRAIPINELEREAAELLVTEPAKGVLHYREAARDFILDQAACQPFIIQHLCSQCFSICRRAKDGDVTLDVAQRAAQRFMEDQTHFSQVWKADIADARTQLLAMLICQASSGRSPVTAELLRQLVSALDIRPSREFSDFLEVLCNLHVIKRDTLSGQTVYRIAMPLFATWLTDRSDFITDCVSRIRHEHDSSL